MNSTPCVVHFARSGREVTAAAGETLLEIAEANGIPLDSLCRGGTCGTCKVKLRSGQPAISTLHALNKRQRQAGFILACSARTTPGQRIVLEA